MPLAKPSHSFDLFSCIVVLPLLHGNSAHVHPLLIQVRMWYYRIRQPFLLIRGHVVTFVFFLKMFSVMDIGYPKYSDWFAAKKEPSFPKRNDVLCVVIHYLLHLKAICNFYHSGPLLLFSLTGISLGRWLTCRWVLIFLSQRHWPQIVTITEYEYNTNCAVSEMFGPIFLNVTDFIKVTFSCP